VVEKGRPSGPAHNIRVDARILPSVRHRDASIMRLDTSRWFGVGQPAVALLAGAAGSLRTA
jgi:hypothetical protein